MSWHEGAHLLSPSATSISCTVRAVAMVSALTAPLTSSSSKVVTFEDQTHVKPAVTHFQSRSTQCNWSFGLEWS